MKRKKSKNQPNTKKAALPDGQSLIEPSTGDAITPEAKAAIALSQELDRLSKYGEYFQKRSEFNAKDGGEERFQQTINYIYTLMEEEEWFAENTPYPFKFIHHNRLGELAFLICRCLKKIALADNNDAIQKLALITVDMTDALTQLLTGTSEAARRNIEIENQIASKTLGQTRHKLQSNAEMMRPISQSIPYWPMLRFLNTAANSEDQFQRIAQELKLGVFCPINVSQTANYSLEIPINAFVWKRLRHFQGVLWRVRQGMQPATNFDDAFDQAIKPYIIREIKSPATGNPIKVGVITAPEIPIYKASFQLPLLTKATAKMWADEAIMPYVCLKYPDFSKVREFQNLLKRDGLKTRGQQRKEVRKDILRALTSMARP
jgi:hypothetical protein